MGVVVTTSSPASLPLPVYTTTPGVTSGRWKSEWRGSCAADLTTCAHGSLRAENPSFHPSDRLQEEEEWELV